MKRLAHRYQPHHSDMNLQRRFVVRSNLAHDVTASLTMVRALNSATPFAFFDAAQGLTDPRLHSASGGSLREQAGVCILRTPLRTARQKFISMSR
jgi:hypothetical protein